MVVSNHALGPEEIAEHKKQPLTSEGNSDLAKFCELTKEDKSESLKGLPGAISNRDEGFGLTNRVRYAEWFGQKIKLVKDSELLLRVSARAMRRPMSKLRSAIHHVEKLRSLLKERNVTATGLSKRDQVLPVWMRSAGRRRGRHPAGFVVRRKGAGRKTC